MEDTQMTTTADQPRLSPTSPTSHSINSTISHHLDRPCTCLHCRYMTPKRIRTLSPSVRSPDPSLTELYNVKSLTMSPELSHRELYSDSIEFGSSAQQKSPITMWAWDSRYVAHQRTETPWLPSGNLSTLYLKKYKCIRCGNKKKRMRSPDNLPCCRDVLKKRRHKHYIYLHSGGPDVSSQWPFQPSEYLPLKLSDDEFSRHCQLCRKHEEKLIREALPGGRKAISVDRIADVSGITDYTYRHVHKKPHEDPLDDILTGSSSAHPTNVSEAFQSIGVSAHLPRPGSSFKSKHKVKHPMSKLILPVLAPPLGPPPNKLHNVLKRSCYQRVIAFNDNDGVFYPGAIQKCVSPDTSVVRFRHNGALSELPNHLTLPVIDMLHTQTLNDGDTALVRVKNVNSSCECWIPARVFGGFIGSPDPRYPLSHRYEMRLFTGARHVFRRRDILRISPLFYQNLIDYIYAKRGIERPEPPGAGVKAEERPTLKPRKPSVKTTVTPAVVRIPRQTTNRQMARKELEKDDGKPVPKESEKPVPIVRQVPQRLLEKRSRPPPPADKPTENMIVRKPPATSKPPDITPRPLKPISRPQPVTTASVPKPDPAKTTIQKQRKSIQQPSVQPVPKVEDKTEKKPTKLKPKKPTPSKQRNLFAPSKAGIDPARGKLIGWSKSAEAQSASHVTASSETRENVSSDVSTAVAKVGSPDISRTQSENTLAFERNENDDRMKQTGGLEALTRENSVGEGNTMQSPYPDIKESPNLENIEALNRIDSPEPKHPEEVGSVKTDYDLGETNLAIESHPVITHSKETIQREVSQNEDQGRNFDITSDHLIGELVKNLDSQKLISEQVTNISENIYENVGKTDDPKSIIESTDGKNGERREMLGMPDSSIIKVLNQDFDFDQTGRLAESTEVSAPQVISESKRIENVGKVGTTDTENLHENLAPNLMEIKLVNIAANDEVAGHDSTEKIVSIEANLNEDSLNISITISKDVAAKKTDLIERALADETGNVAGVSNQVLHTIDEKKMINAEKMNAMTVGYEATEDGVKISEPVDNEQRMKVARGKQFGPEYETSVDNSMKDGVYNAIDSEVVGHLGSEQAPIPEKAVANEAAISYETDNERSKHTREGIIGGPELFESAASGLRVTGESQRVTDLSTDIQHLKSVNAGEMKPFDSTGPITSQAIDRKEDVHAAGQLIVDEKQLSIAALSTDVKNEDSGDLIPRIDQQDELKPTVNVSTAPSDVVVSQAQSSQPIFEAESIKNKSKPDSYEQENCPKAEAGVRHLAETNISIDAERTDLVVPQSESTLDANAVFVSDGVRSTAMKSDIKPAGPENLLIQGGSGVLSDHKVEEGVTALNAPESLLDIAIASENTVEQDPKTLNTGEPIKEEIIDGSLLGDSAHMTSRPETHTLELGAASPSAVRSGMISHLDTILSHDDIKSNKITGEDQHDLDISVPVNIKSSELMHPSLLIDGSDNVEMIEANITNESEAHDYSHICDYTTEVLLSVDDGANKFGPPMTIITSRPYIDPATNEYVFTVKIEIDKSEKYEPVGTHSKDSDKLSQTSHDRIYENRIQDSLNQQKNQHDMNESQGSTSRLVSDPESQEITHRIAKITKLNTSKNQTSIGGEHQLGRIPASNETEETDISGLIIKDIRGKSAEALATASLKDSSQTLGIVNKNSLDIIDALDFQKDSASAGKFQSSSLSRDDPNNHDITDKLIKSEKYENISAKSVPDEPQLNIVIENRIEFDKQQHGHHRSQQDTQLVDSVAPSITLHSMIPTVGNSEQYANINQRDGFSGAIGPDSESDVINLNLALSLNYLDEGEIEVITKIDLDGQPNAIPEPEVVTSLEFKETDDGSLPLDRIKEAKNPLETDSNGEEYEPLVGRFDVQLNGEDVKCDLSPDDQQNSGCYHYHACHHTTDIEIEIEQDVCIGKNTNKLDISRDLNQSNINFTGTYQTNSPRVQSISNLEPPFLSNHPTANCSLPISCYGNRISVSPLGSYLKDTNQSNEHVTSNHNGMCDTKAHMRNESDLNRVNADSRIYVTHISNIDACTLEEKTTDLTNLSIGEIPSNMFCAILSVYDATHHNFISWEKQANLMEPLRKRNIHVLTELPRVDLSILHDSGKFDLSSCVLPTKVCPFAGDVLRIESPTDSQWSVLKSQYSTSETCTGDQQIECYCSVNMETIVRGNRAESYECVSVDSERNITDSETCTSPCFDTTSASASTKLLGEMCQHIRVRCSAVTSGTDLASRCSKSSSNALAECSRTSVITTSLRRVYDVGQMEIGYLNEKLTCMPQIYLCLMSFLSDTNFGTFFTYTCEKYQPTTLVDAIQKNEEVLSEVSCYDIVQTTDIYVEINNETFKAMANQHQVVSEFSVTHSEEGLLLSHQNLTSERRTSFKPYGFKFTREQIEAFCKSCILRVISEQLICDEFGLNVSAVDDTNRFFAFSNEEKIYDQNSRGLSDNGFLLPLRDDTISDDYDTTSCSVNLDTIIHITSVNPQMEQAHNIESRQSNSSLLVLYPNISNTTANAIHLEHENSEKLLRDVTESSCEFWEVDLPNVPSFSDQITILCLCDGVTKQDGMLQCREGDTVFHVTITQVYASEYHISCWKQPRNPTVARQQSSRITKLVKTAMDSVCNSPKVQSHDVVQTIQPLSKIHAFQEIVRDDMPHPITNIFKLGGFFTITESGDQGQQKITNFQNTRFTDALKLPYEMEVETNHISQITESCDNVVLTTDSCTARTNIIGSPTAIISNTQCTDDPIETTSAEWVTARTEDTFSDTEPFTTYKSEIAGTSNSVLRNMRTNICMAQESTDAVIEHGITGNFSLANEVQNESKLWTPATSSPKLHVDTAKIQQRNKEGPMLTNHETTTEINSPLTFNSSEIKTCNIPASPIRSLLSTVHLPISRANEESIQPISEVSVKSQSPCAGDRVVHSDENRSKIDQETSERSPEPLSKRSKSLMNRVCAQLITGCKQLTGSFVSSNKQAKALQPIVTKMPVYVKKPSEPLTKQWSRLNTIKTTLTGATLEKQGPRATPTRVRKVGSIKGLIRETKVSLELNAKRHMQRAATIAPVVRKREQTQPLTIAQRSRSINNLSTKKTRVSNEKQTSANIRNTKRATELKNTVKRSTIGTKSTTKFQ